MTRRFSIGLGIAAMGVAANTVAAPANTSLDAAQSHVEVTFLHDHRAEDAPFRIASGHVDYDEGRPANAHAAFEVEPSQQAPLTESNGPAWFQTSDLPRARFVSTSVVPGPAGQLDAIGTLTINGKSRKIRIPLFAGPAIGGEIFDGSFEISRNDFDIGMNRPNGLIDDRVRVRFHLFQPYSA